MDHFTVDIDKCNACGICVDECPTRVIEIRDGARVPSRIDKSVARCINCGHCVTVCPHGAFSLRTMALEDCPPVRVEWQLRPEHVAHLLRSRRSIRAFKDEAVDRALLAELIDVARYAPTGSNSQRVNWLVISGEDRIYRLAEITMDWIRSMQQDMARPSDRKRFGRLLSSWDEGTDIICRGAPHVVIAHGQASARTDCIIALTYLELIAYSHGLGPCWGGWLDGAANNWQPMQEYLELPEGHTSCGTMMIGYPKYKYRRIPLRNEARITWR